MLRDAKSLVLFNHMNVMQTRMRPRRARKALLVARMQLALDVAGQSIQHFSHRCQCASLGEKYVGGKYMGEKSVGEKFMVEPSVGEKYG